jgi:hypothetical protein
MHENRILPPAFEANGLLAERLRNGFRFHELLSAKASQGSTTGWLTPILSGPAAASRAGEPCAAPIAKKAQPATALCSYQKAEAVTGRGAGSRPRPVCRSAGISFTFALRPLMTGGFSLGQLISRHRRACATNELIRLFQNVGICRLFSSEEAEHYEGCARRHTSITFR